MPDTLFAILLAAGGSSRFGSPKQLVKWRGSSLLEHTLQRLQALFGDQVIVVLGAYADAIRVTLQPTLATIIENVAWQEGMSTSIRAGVNALPEHVEAVMLSLSDQPLLETDVFERLIAVWKQQPGSIVASQYEDTIGVPAIFPACMFPTLKALSGDVGAKKILSSLSDQVITVNISEAGIDIDTKEDFHHIQRMHL